VILGMAAGLIITLPQQSKQDSIDPQRLSLEMSMMRLEIYGVTLA